MVEAIVAAILWLFDPTGVNPNRVLVDCRLIAGLKSEERECE